MGQELQRRSPGTVARQSDPSWPTVAGTTMRLWLDRHYRRRAGRRRLVLLLSALLAMAFGAGVTLAFTQPDHGTATARGSATSSAGALQLAAAARQQAAAWIAREVASNIVVGCDLEMCNELQKSGFPAARLLPLQPIGSRPARRAAGRRDAGDQEPVRHPPGHRLRAAGDRQLRLRRGAGRRALYRAGRQQGVRGPARRLPAGTASPRGGSCSTTITSRPPRPHAANSLAGQVDPRLLVTLSTLADLMPLKLIAFDDLSPGASADVPMRGAEIGAAASTGLPAMVAFMRAQQGEFAPAVARITQDAGGRHVFIVRYDAPGPMGLEGS